VKTTIANNLATLEADAKVIAAIAPILPFASDLIEIDAARVRVDMGQRLAGHRANLGIGTPFYGEGWPLYWDTLLYDIGFLDTPEKKVGALFWRMHRTLGGLQLRGLKAELVDTGQMTLKEFHDAVVLQGSMPWIGSSTES